MCGIIAYQGPQDAAKICLEGLKKLEYRGYDSWGIVTISEKSGFIISKQPGKIGEIKYKDLHHQTSETGIGHTRWATHGGVNKRNAHPHLSMSSRFAVVQNGIVENYEELKSQLCKKGYKFKSETDTEVIANLIDKVGTGQCPVPTKSKVKSLLQAVRLAFQQLKGRNAIAVLDNLTGTIIAVRNGSPLIVGVGDRENFVASDIPAFLQYTNKVKYLDDNQMVVMEKSQPLKFYDVLTGRGIKRRTISVNLKPEQAEKGAYSHFMIKEIKEQKETIRRAVNQDDKKIEYAANLIKKSKGVFLIGAGTAGKVCHFAEYLFSKICQEHLNFIMASEFKNYLHFIKKGSLIIVVSQSGETADVLEPLEIAKKQGARIVSIVNVAGSSLYRKSDYSFLINAGPEKAVASTKATTAQMSVIALLAYALADKLNQGKQNLANLVASINDLLNPRYEARIKRLAKKLKDSPNIYIIGRGVNYPAALESEIKLMEVSYIHAQGFAGGELKHGPIALIEKNTPCIVLSADDDLQDEIHSNAKEIKARGGYIIGISPCESKVYDWWLKVPNLAEELSAIVNLIPVQILAYHLSVLRGNNPDMPRNLAKAVTVK